MAEKNKSDLFVYLIGIVIIGYIVFQIIGYILPDQEPDYTATTLLETVIDKNNGKDAWDNIKNMSYRKSFKLFHEDGTIEKDLIENYIYDFTDGINREITWSQKDTLYEIHRSDSVIYQIKNGTADTLVTPTQLQAKLDTSTFVVGLPYTLDDPSTMLAYEGVAKFQDIPCHTLKVTFKDSKDVWSFYYEEKTLSWKGYWIQSPDHYSLIINEEMIEESGFTLSRKRKSYRTDKKQNILYLRAVYEYDAYKIFNKNN